MDQQYGLLNEDEVLHISFGRILMANPTFKVGEFLDALAQLISEHEGKWADENEGWFGDGLECEALRFSNQGWQRGKVRIRLEFCPPDNKPKLLRTSSQQDEPYLRAEVRPREDYPPREDIYRRPPRDDIYREDIYRGEVYNDEDY